MDDRKNTPGIALGNAFVLVSVAALTLVLTASLLARVGMPFAASYTVGIIACILGTLTISYEGRTRIALPSPAVTTWLVYEEIIAHGRTWQEMLGIALVISLLGAILMRTTYADALTRALPPVVRTGLVLGLGLSMLTAAALCARILLPSPWALTMSGTLSDPLTYYTLVGILLVLLLHARQICVALPLGMIVISVLTWAEGFWEIPAAPFFAPDIISLPFVLMLPQTDAFLAAGLGLTLLLALMIEGTAVLEAETERMVQARRPLARLFAVSTGAAIIGSFPLTIAPISAALPAEGAERRIAGIPLTAGIAALLLAFLLPCAPLMQALSDFPAVPAIALAVMGLLLLMRGIQMLKSTAEVTLRESSVIAVFLLSAYDIKTGMAAALLTWTLFTAACGERIPRAAAVLTALVFLFVLLKWFIWGAFSL